MRTSFLCLLVLAGLTTGLQAQIPNTWTQEKLKKGDVITWTDRISGYSVTEGAEGFNFTARRNDKVQVTAKYDEIPHGSKFVLTDIGD